MKKIPQLLEPPIIKIIEKNDDFEEYVLNNFPVYKSNFVYCQQLMCEGKLYKKCKSVLEEFQQRDFEVSFHKGVINIIKDNDERKSIFFSQLNSVEKADLDLFKGESNSPWKFKFLLLLNTSEPLLLYARNRKERSIWMQTFCRVLDA